MKASKEPIPSDGKGCRGNRYLYIIRSFIKRNHLQSRIIIFFAQVPADGRGDCREADFDLRRSPHVRRARLLGSQAKVWTEKDMQSDVGLEKFKVQVDMDAARVPTREFNNYIQAETSKKPTAVGTSPRHQLHKKLSAA